MVKQAPSHQQDLVLADIPERQRLRQLQAELASLRDHIAATDLEIETLRDQLGEFEAHYHAQLRPEHEQVRRIRSWLQHVERWSEALEQQVRAPAPEVLVQRIERLEGRRTRELKQQKAAEQQARAARDAHGENAEKAKAAPAPRAADVAERLKTAYRELARRFHPDLARTEEERLANSQMMARINDLYRAGDMDRLVALREQARGGELDESLDLSLEEQLGQLEERHAWFVTVEQNLQDERASLEQSATCELWRNVEQAQANGRDLLEELRQQTQARILRLLEDIPYAARSLENAVNRYNRDLTKKDKPGALELSFDPYEDKSMVRLALDELGQQQVSPAVRRQAREVEQLAEDRPALLRLLLLTYVSELSPLPLAGLERYEDLQLRFATLAAQDAEPLSLEAALVESDAWLEFGVRQATAKLAHAGLRFRQKNLRDAIPVALGALPVRRAFKQVLAVLGEHTTCTGCHEPIFAVPLYRTRGLDDLRASVCPRCGAMLNSYWMPRGKDVQAVLNAAFLDFEIVSEFSFALGRASIAMQLVPQQVETLTVGDIKKRLVQDIFTRHEIAITAAEVQLHQKGKPVRDGTSLHRIETPRFTVRFAADAKLSEADALELVRHRIRTRFQA